MTKANPKLLGDLKKKLGVSRATLYRRVAERRRELLCETPEALYSVAFDEGFDLTTYLSPEEIKAVRPFVSGRSASSAAPASGGEEPARAPMSRDRSKAKPALVSIGGVNVERLPGMSAKSAQEAKTMAEKVYPMLYVFENSARQLIAALLGDAFGKDWWDQVVPAKIRTAAQKRKDGEGDDPWHERRGNSMIDYTMLSELPGIVGANETWPHFKPIFVRKSFFEELVNDFNVSRRVSAHMNPISTDDRKHIEAAFRKWSGTLKAKRDLGPPTNAR